jgi:deoxyribonuclease V
LKQRVAGAYNTGMRDLLPDIPDLPGHLRELMQQVPAGRVTTAGALAEALGNPVAARWVGHFLLHHEHDAGCSCHRALRAGGALGPYIAGGAEAKAQRLRAEAVEVVAETVDLQRYAFRQFIGDRPLEQLRRAQEAILSKVEIRPRRQVPRWVGGVDVSYASRDEGVAAYALVDMSSGDLAWSATVRRPVRFPYISSYLTFRELPLYVELLAAVRAAGRMAPLVLVDGTGILHPRRAGIATHLGVVLRVPTIGLTKKLLCGQVDTREMLPLESRPVVHGNEEIGVALRPTAGSRRPIFVSPGHRVDVAFAEQIVRRLLAGHRLPEPLYWADRLSRQHAQTV